MTKGISKIIILSLLTSFIEAEVTYNCWLDNNSDNKCCDSTSIEPSYVDKDGHFWAYENNELCAIKEPDCFTELIGYKCCPGSNISYIDDDGEWGFQNNDWCGINFKKRWNDRSIISDTYDDWNKYKKTFADEIYPAKNNKRIINEELRQIYDFREQLSMNVGGDETKLNFGWYSKSNKEEPKIRILDITQQGKIKKNKKEIIKIL